jgi:anion-transporting  ArsA/GET3 family ATPase
MALQKLQALHDAGKFDYIILDTPPSRSTLEFLEAPRLLSQLFEANFIQWLIVPANRLASAAMKKALGLLEKLTGASFMGHMLDFITALFEMRAGFSEHLKRMIRLMESEEVGVVLVTGAHSDFTEELAHFRGHLEKHGLKLDSMIINRTLGAYEASPSASASTSAEAEMASRVLQSLRKREQKALDQLKISAQQTPLQLMPELARDVHSLQDLAQIARRLQ